MITSTSLKRDILPVNLVVCLVAIFTLYKPTTLFAQEGNSTLQIYALPPVTATVTFEADPDAGDQDAAGKLSNDDSQSSNFVLPPPANDNCSTALNAANTLTPGANYKCSAGAAVMGTATVEAGEFTGCFAPAPIGTVWHSFIADQATMWIAVKPSNAVCGSLAGTIPSSFGLAVYQSTTCFPNIPIACLNYYPANTSAANWSMLSKVNLAGLIPGQTYMVQVAFYASCAGNTWKPYCIKIGHPTTCTTCATNCGPMCVWAGPTPPTVPNITSTCPSYGWAPPLNLGDSQTNCFSFTATNDTVWLQQIVNSYCNPNTLSFTYNLYNAGCGLIGSGNVFVNNQITGLVVGTTYKICYTLTAACTWDSIFWPYAYTTSTTLPVELVSLGAMPYKDKIKIYWATASEENAKEFVIERTHNGRDFKEIARVSASGNSTNLINYKGYDDDPLKGENYYRLKQIDFNGESTYTKLVSAKFLPSVADLGVIPNPAKDEAVVRFNAGGNFTAALKVTNMQGITVWSKQIATEEGMNLYSLNLDELTRGIYSIQVLVDDQQMISKLVKE